jgi:hypothetical protein
MVIDCRNAKGHAGRLSDQMPEKCSDRRMEKYWHYSAKSREQKL